MSVAFWSVKLTNGKAVEVQPPEGYVLNVMQAAYSGNDHAVIKVHTTSVEGEKLESIIGTLRAKTNEQFTLDLVFGYDVPVAFSAEGKGEVYLNGYYQPGPEEEDEENDYDDEFGSEEDSEDEEDDEDEEGSEDDDEEQNIKNAEAAIAKLGASRGKDLAVTGKKISKAQEQSDSEEGSEDDEDSEGDSEDERIDQDFVAKMISRHGLGKAPKSAQVEELGSDEDSEEEEGSEDEEESEEESEEEQPPMKVQKTQPKGVVTQGGSKGQNKPNTPAGKPQQNQAQNSKPNTPANKQNNGQNKTPNGKPQQGQNKTPNTNNKQQNSGFKSGDKRKR